MQRITITSKQGPGWNIHFNDLVFAQKMIDLMKDIILGNNHMLAIVIDHVTPAGDPLRTIIPRSVLLDSVIDYNSHISITDRMKATPIETPLYPNK